MSMQTLAPLRVGVIGAGRVGAVLGAALADSGHRILAATAVSAASQDRAARLLPHAALLAADEVLARVDLVLLAVPDDILTDLVRSLAESGAFRNGQIVVHTSGAHGLGVLQPAEQRGVLPLALHPVMTFAGRPEDVQRLIGAPFGVTAAEEHRAVAETLVLEMGGEPVWIEELARTLYHAALVVGSNHLITLVAEARDLLVTAGVQDPARLLAPLLGAALDNSLRYGDKALTGPVSRGDVGTVRRHLRTLVDQAPGSVPSYVAMARRTAQRALASGRLKRHEAAPLLDLLAERPAPASKATDPASAPPAPGPAGTSVTVR